MASAPETFRRYTEPRAKLQVATLRALAALEADAFRRHLPAFFAQLTRLIACGHAPPEVQRALSDLFADRIGPLLAEPQ